MLDQKRRFVQIRAASGATGWVDALQLLTPEQMSELQKEHEYALSLPSEGSAIGLRSSEYSPGAEPAVAVVRANSGRRLRAGVAIQTDAARERCAKAACISRLTGRNRRRKKKKEAKPSLRLPPKPPPPGLPPDYDELSAAQGEAPKPLTPIAPEAPAKPPVMEEWTLVRTKDNQTGWVLSRNLYMSIPDEVAQYAEGKRITSYFSLGEVKDDEMGVVKHDWLWTTLSDAADYDFDGWRVFIWSRRHHRFETSYRQHGVEGYFPGLGGWKSVHVDHQRRRR